MLNKELLQSKLDLIMKYYQELKVLLDKPLETVKNDTMRYYAVERVFQLLVDEIIDVNTALIKQSGFELPEDYQSTFDVLAQNKILLQSFALRLAPCVGLRNRLVHRYEEIDKDKALQMIYKEKEDFVEYVKLIQKRLN